MNQRSVVLVLSVFFLFLATYLNASSPVKEITNMSEISNHIDSDTLLIFDLDNTVMEPVQSIGSHQWYDHVVANLQKQGLSKEASKKKARQYWDEVHKRCRMKPVEAATPQLIKAYQDKEIKITALTARSTATADDTIRQVEEVGVQFHAKPIYPKEVIINTPSKTRFYKGVLFAQDMDKGKVLTQFLKQTQLKPEKIVMVDDRKENIENVQKALGENIEFIGLRYNFLDKKVTEFDPEVSDIQGRFMDQILTDDAAEAILLAD